MGENRLNEGDASLHELKGMATRIRFYLGESDHFRGRPLYHEIVLEAKSAGLAGVTVFRGIEGYGASSRIKSVGVLDLSSDLPVVVEIVDGEDRIGAILPRLLDMVDGGLVTRESVAVLKYTHPPERRG